jgi:hypothetical protein
VSAQPTRTAVYGPVRTVVWQGSAGDRRPYADLVGYSYMCFVLVTGDAEVGTCCAGTVWFRTMRSRVKCSTQIQEVALLFGVTISAQDRTCSLQEASALFGTRKRAFGRKTPAVLGDEFINSIPDKGGEERPEGS